MPKDREFYADFIDMFFFKQVALILRICWPFSERIALNSGTGKIRQDLVGSFDPRHRWLLGQHRVPTFGSKKSIFHKEQGNFP